MIRVCHVTSAHTQEDIRIFKKECVSLAEAGYEVFLVSQGCNQEKDGVHFKAIGKQPKSRLKRMIFFTKRAYKKALELDAVIYHFHDPEMLPYAYKMSKKGKKVIFDSHEFTALQLAGGARTYIPKWLRSIVSTLYRYFERKVTRQIEGVIIPCTIKGRDYFNGNYKRLAYVNNVPRISDYSYSEDIKRDTYTTCYVGSITKARGIVNTIKASYYANCRLKLVGGVDGDLLEELKNMKEFECVDYYGRLPVEEFTKVISSSNVALSLIKKMGQYDEGDNLSTKIYEYMVMGIPMVVSDMRMNRKIVEGNDCGICVDPDNVEEISKAILKICADQDLSDRLSKNGRNLVEKMFSWEVEKDNLLELYKDILS